jgi:hypothetical protein
MTAGPEDHMPGRNRRGNARRKYAAWCGAIAAVLLLGGLLLAGMQEGSWREIGVAAVGYGIGVAVAAVFLASGYEPRKRR